MPTANPSPSGNRPASMLRFLRPLIIWGLLVFVLWGIRSHKRLIEDTRLSFEVRLGTENLGDEAKVMLDGAPFVSGTKIGLGQHRLAIQHERTVPIFTNFFAWYGPHDLGRLNLTRATGILAIEVNPAAMLLEVFGKELTIGLTNATGLTSSVPTGLYAIDASGRIWAEKRRVLVTAGGRSTERIAPKLGGLKITSSHPGADFQLSDVRGKNINDDQLPVELSDLPEGNYQLVVTRRTQRHEERIRIEAGAVVERKVEFQYGTAVFETEPAGATVYASDGRECGLTPLTVAELRPGASKWTIEGKGYDSVAISLFILPNETNTFRTNLVNQMYARAMGTGRQLFSDGDVERAIEAAQTALREKPGDPDALALGREATRRRDLLRVQKLGAQGNFAAAREQLAALAKTAPDDEMVKKLAAELQQREVGAKEDVNRQAKEQVELADKARRNRFDSVLAAARERNDDSRLFTSHNLKSGRPAKQVGAAIVDALKNQAPAFSIIRFDEPKPETFVIEAGMDIPGGRRKCLIVGGQMPEEQTLIVFHVLEYTTQHNIRLEGLFRPVDDVVNYPVHPKHVKEMTDKYRAQLAEGIRVIGDRIQGAIGTRTGAAQ